ncbi:ABC transporter ATP-binding protein [Geomicrobium sediminis]|uniref:Iron complex transport system ATP-binding protein n=1 Tax=Geomicrobium sediminis TaxID=1347788 RepID=A0ABS2PBQ6_9BACL|nr:ABC transporter ATP-binding protein [Geomicrobium sediminis]MBM7632744.1 iron complex transport system ATP-binding protein [Geomicrobium sediminis]
MTEIETKELSIGYEKRKIVEALNLKIPKGQITTMIGPNGCGKSTILKTLARIMKPKSGSVYLDGKIIHKESTKQVAKKLAVLPQSPEAPSGLKVKELVAYGRYPHQSGARSLTKADLDIIDRSLKQTGMDAFKDRDIDALSGGQRQRVWIAMALAQETDILLLDEPTTYLDLAHQLEVLEVLKRLNEEEGRTIVMVIHDLNHAARFADYMVALKAGKIVQEGAPEQVICSTVLKDVFAIDADVVTDPRTKKPVCLSYDLMIPERAEEEELIPAGGAR